MIRPFALIPLAFLVATSGCGSAAKREAKNQAGAADEFQIRSFTTQTLSNGMTILWIPDNSLPYVTLQLLVKSGSGSDPAGKEGVAGMAASLLEKGTADRNAVQISEALEQIGSGFEVDVQPDYMIAASSSLSFNKDEVLALFSEILQKPSFPAAELERQRKNTLAGLQKLADRPDAFADYLFPSYLYGSHPYGHSPAGTPRSVRGLTVADLRQYYERNFAPANAVLAVVGQYDEAWQKKVADAFQGWRAGQGKAVEVPEFPTWRGTQVLLVNRPDLNQARIQIGFKGIPRDIPEYMELRAAVKILGEGFGSRLFDEIREKRGLTYGIHAWFDPRLKPGPMGIETFTRVDKIGETVDETLRVYRQFVKDGVTDAEVTQVKALMRGQFPRMFETPEGLARQLLILQRYGISADYLKNYFANLDRIDKVKINATIRKYFDPENLRVLVYAPRGKAEESLKRLGALEVKEYREFLQ